VEARQKDQLKTADEFKTFIGFSFTDQVSDSGIKFRNRVVEDAGITYKAVHYDHGNGIAVADVDLDGRYDIYFVNQVGANELWRNLGDGKFEDITEKAGVAAADRISVAAAMADIDNDGDPDLYVTSVRKGNLLFENQGNGQFKDISAESGLGHKGYSLHSLRHTFATNMLNAGLRLEVLQQILGHLTIDITLQYARISDMTREDAYFKAMKIIEQGGNHEHDRVNSELQAVFEEKKFL
jgi:hypothetical protein